MNRTIITEGEKDASTTDNFYSVYFSLFRKFVQLELFFPQKIIIFINKLL